jgi:hypothetical protein
MAVAVLAGAGLVTAGPARAVSTPIYNAPTGGGPVTEVVEKVGPFNLDPVGGAHDQVESENLVPRPAGGYGIKYASFDLVDENGVPVGRHDVHLHHFVIGALNKVDPACPGRKEAGMFVQPLIGSGMERTPISFPDPYALQVDPLDQWGAVWHLMNMTDTPKKFYVQYTLGIQYYANATNTRFVTPYWADSSTCPAGTTWNVPGNGGFGSIETRTKTWSMPFDGYIVGLGGHVHDGGISIVTKHEDGTLICENDATYSGGMLDKISGCPTHDTVKKGETLSVTSNYDNSAPHADVMGIAVMFLWQGDQGVPPTTTTTAAPTTTTTAPGSTTTTTTTAADPVVAAAAVSATPVFAG